jgi:hypothetical protein
MMSESTASPITPAPSSRREIARQRILALRSVARFGKGEKDNTNVLIRKVAETCQVPRVPSVYRLYQPAT